jgi:hypothetical protein
MCMHPGGDIMATGARASSIEGKDIKNELANIKVWKSSTLELMVEIRGFHK